MNTKKIFFAFAAFGMLALATYVPNSSSEDAIDGSTSIEKATARIDGGRR